MHKYVAGRTGGRLGCVGYIYTMCVCVCVCVLLGEWSTNFGAALVAAHSQQLLPICSVLNLSIKRQEAMVGIIAGRTKVIMKSG